GIAGAEAAVAVTGGERCGVIGRHGGGLSGELHNGQSVAENLQFVNFPSQRTPGASGLTRRRFTTIVIAESGGPPCQITCCSPSWANVALRVVHSLVQALANVILVRFGVFMAASLVLLALAIRAAMAVF